MSKKYLVVKHWWGEENPVRDNNVRVMGLFADLDKAKETLKEEALRWKEENYTALCDVDKEDWKPGFHNDEDSWKWSSCAFDDDLMFAYCLDDERTNFEGIEIQEIEA